MLYIIMYITYEADIDKQNEKNNKKVTGKNMSHFHLT